MAESPAAIPFRVRDCALAAISTGRRAADLRQLQEGLKETHVGAIYYHFWGALLRPQFENPEYINDFAGWAWHGLHDRALAERLSVVDPREYPNLEDLRNELVRIVDNRLAESDTVPVAPRDMQFHMIRSQIVVFDTHKALTEPRELATAVPSMAAGSVFYHFIDARRRTDGGIDDFRAWLRGFGDQYAKLITRIADVDPYFVSLTDLREQLSEVFVTYFSGNAS